MRRIITAFLLSGVWVCSLTSAALASEGFYLGGQIPYNMISGDFDDTGMPKVDPGSGIGIIAGYGITQNVSLEIDWSGSSHKSAGSQIGFGEFSLNGKFNIPISNETQPYLFFGAGSFALGDNSLTFGGSGYNLGVGSDFYINQHLSWGVALVRKFITYDKIIKSDVPLRMRGNLNGDTTSIRFDVTYHF